MAVYNEIGIGRWNRFIQKITDIKGGPPARQLASEIIFQHPIFHGAENRYLESWDMFALGFQVPAIAGQPGCLRLRNPLGSNVVCVFTSMKASAAVATEFELQQGRGVGDLNTALVITNAIDARSPRTAPSIVASYNTIAPGTFNIIGRVSAAAGIPFDFTETEYQELPLLPGDAFQLEGVLVNTAVDFSVFWRERFLEPAERI